MSRELNASVAGIDEFRIVLLLAIPGSDDQRRIRVAALELARTHDRRITGSGKTSRSTP
jgi:hypothetical protein